MKIKKLIIAIIITILVIITVIGVVKYKNTKKEIREREDIKIPVLAYHNFVTTVPEVDPDDFNYINTPQSFEENIKVLLENGYTVISLKELNDANEGKFELPQKPIIITFDDGYYSNYEYIYPILKKYNVKASIFIVTNQVAREINGIKYFGWDECKEMQDSGLIEIYSHSKKHVFYERFPVKELKRDVRESYKIIEEKLGYKEFKAFAYPYGSYTKKEVKALERSGINMQVYDLGINNFKDLNMNFIKRINIPCEMTGKEIVEEIEK